MQIRDFADKTGCRYIRYTVVLGRSYLCLGWCGSQKFNGAWLQQMIQQRPPKTTYDLMQANRIFERYTIKSVSSSFAEVGCFRFFSRFLA